MDEIVLRLASAAIVSAGVPTGILIGHFTRSELRWGRLGFILGSWILIAILIALPNHWGTKVAALIILAGSLALEYKKWFLDSDRFYAQTTLVAIMLLMFQTQYTTPLAFVFGFPAGSLLLTAKIEHKEKKIAVLCAIFFICTLLGREIILHA